MEAFLRRKRQAAALTQKQASSLLGYKTSQFISDLERGRRTPPPQTLKKMCDVYQISESEMLSEYLQFTATRAQAKALANWQKETAHQ